MGEGRDPQVDTDHPQGLSLGFIDCDGKARLDRNLIAGHSPRESALDGGERDPWDDMYLTLVIASQDPTLDGIPIQAGDDQPCAIAESVSCGAA
jgi:hypothetical protein